MGSTLSFKILRIIVTAATSITTVFETLVFIICNNSHREGKNYHWVASKFDWGDTGQ